MDHVDRITPPPRAGERLVVRYRLPDGSATDVLGWLEDLDPEELVLSDERGRKQRVSRGTVVAARRVPVARGGPDPGRTTAAELERIALPGWVAEHEPLGEWTLRAAGGFTGRANSCLAVGDPGVCYPEAAGRVITYALTHGIRPMAQVVADSEPEHALVELGWQPTYVPTDVLAARLGQLLGTSLPDPRVTLFDELEPPWWTAYHLSRPNSADPDVLRRILAGGRPRALAGVSQADGLIAIGRGHVSADWLGLASLWTAPDQRRQGWATAVITALGHWGARLGARNVYLQVAQENEQAHRAYERLGFRLHHSYRYLAPTAD